MDFNRVKEFYGPPLWSTINIIGWPEWKLADNVTLRGWCSFDQQNTYTENINRFILEQESSYQPSLCREELVRKYVKPLYEGKTAAELVRLTY